jgi:hypothetical protein
MRSTLSRDDAETETTYPCLMTGTRSGVVILFHAEGKGVVVHNKGTGGSSEGYYSEDWYMGSFTPFDGTVTLENDA